MVSGSSAILWCNYRRDTVANETIAVPSPADGSSDVWWYDYIAQNAQKWASQGFTHILFPNPVMNVGGAGVGDDGYGPLDDYNWGSKGSPTRFGTDTQLRRAVAVCHANGLRVLFDIVNRQRDGGSGTSVYQYASATGSKNGRFPKTAACFCRYDANGNLMPGYVPRDPVMAPANDAAYTFGDDLCPQNGLGPNGEKNYVWDNLMAAGDNMLRTFGADGGRIDDAMGQSAHFLNSYCNYGAMKGKWFFVEYSDGNPNNLNYVAEQLLGISVFDFDGHYNRVQPMCNNATSYDMNALANRGFLGMAPMQCVPFVESMDSDVDGFATIVNDKTLGYAYILPGEGRPLAYIRDMLPSSMGGYGLEKAISNAAWFARQCGGPTAIRWQDDKVFVYERTGSGCVVALNNDVFNPDWKTVTIQTTKRNTKFHDYSGKNGQDCWSDGNGMLTFGIPPGANGMGYGFWAEDGISGSVQLPSISTTQTFFCANDLDTAAAVNGNVVLGWKGTPRTITVAAGTQVIVQISTKTAMTADQVLDISVQNGTAEIFGLALKHTGTVAGSFGAHTAFDEVLHFEVWGQNLPADGVPFELTVTYTAPKTI